MTARPLLRSHALHEQGVALRDHADPQQRALASACFIAALRLELATAPRPHWDIGMTCHELGSLAWRDGAWASALAWYQRARLEKEQDVLFPRRVNDYSITLHELGIVLERLGDRRAAIAAYDDALAANAGLAGAERASADESTLSALAPLLRAEELWRRAGGAYRALAGVAGPQGRASALIESAFCDVELESWERADECAREALAILDSLPPPDDGEMRRDALRELVASARGRGDRAAAARWLWQLRGLRG